MNAHELYKKGALADAIEAQLKTVKAQPADQGERIFLFELLAFDGNLDRAQKQIDVVHYDDPKVEAATQAYRKMLDAERRRRELFDNLTAPQFFQPPPEHVKMRLAALQEQKTGRAEEAAKLLQAADAQAPAVAGTCNGTAFSMIRDADDRLGPVLEVMAHGEYFWVPLEQIQTLAMNAPRSPRDLLWFPARMETRDGASGDVFLPVLYPGTHASADFMVKLGRQTDWSDGPGPVTGLGAKTFLVGDEGMALLQWRQVEFT